MLTSNPGCASTPELLIYFLREREKDLAGTTTTGGVAVHVGLDTPPLVPLHVHIHTPAGLGRNKGDPLAQALVPVGTVETSFPVSDPHTPGVATIRGVE
jgi:hypothetical protein